MTPYQKLIDLFSTVVEETNHATGESARTVRGGKGNLARAIGVSHTLIIHWEKRHDGKIPAEYYGRIVEAAKRAGISRDDIEPLFAGCTCPACGRPVVDEVRA